MDGGGWGKGVWGEGRWEVGCGGVGIGNGRGVGGWRMGRGEAVRRTSSGEGMREAIGTGTVPGGGGWSDAGRIRRRPLRKGCPSNV